MKSVDECSSVAPDNIKLEIAKSAIASVTTQDGASAA